MLATEAENYISSTNDSDSEEAVYRSNVSNVTMAETPLRQPISAFAIALRHSLCNHADYLYFSDTYLSHCGQEHNHVSHQVGLSGFQILCDIFCFRVIGFDGGENTYAEVILPFSVHYW